MTIRLANENDVNELIQLNQLFNEVSVSKEHVLHSLLNNTNEIVLVAEDNNQLVGFCSAQIMNTFCYENNLSQIVELFILETHRNKGIGKKLITQMEKEIYKHNSKTVYLHTGKRNLNAQNFYEKNGYTLVNQIIYKKTLG